MRKSIGKTNNKKVFKAVFNAKSAGQAKHNYFKDLTFREVKENFGVAVKSRFFKDAIGLTKYGGVESYLKYKTPYASIEKNIAWCLSLLIYHKKDLQFAIDCDKKIHSLIANEEFDALIKLLDEVDMRCGVSLWSITLRSTTESSSQLTSNFSHNTKNEASIEPLLNYILNHISYHPEHDIFFAALKNDSIEIERSAPDSIKDYLLYVLFGFEAGRFYEFDKIIELIKDTSIIDVFNFLIDYLIFHTKDTDTLKSLPYPAKYIVRDLKDNFEHFPINSLCHFIGIDADWQVSGYEIDIIDLYTKGDYEKVCQKVMGLHASDISFPVFEVAVKANARCNLLKLPGMNELIEHMSNVFLKNSDYEYSLQFLACQAYKKRFNYWFFQLWNFTKKEALFSSMEVRRHYEKIGLLMSPHCGAKKLKVISENKKNNYISFLQSLRPDSPSLHLHRMLENKGNSSSILNLSISLDRKTKYFGMALMQEKKI